MVLAWFQCCFQHIVWSQHKSMDDNVSIQHKRPSFSRLRPIRSAISIYQYIYLDLSPYMRKNQHLKGRNQHLKGRNQRKVLTPCPRHSSLTMPRGERGHHSLSFFYRSDQDKWVVFGLLSTQFFVFVRDHVGRKVVSVSLNWKIPVLTWDDEKESIDFI